MEPIYARKTSPRWWMRGFPKDASGVPLKNPCPSTVLVLRELEKTDPKKFLQNKQAALDEFNRICVDLKDSDKRFALLQDNATKTAAKKFAKMPTLRMYAKTWMDTIGGLQKGHESTGSNVRMLLTFPFVSASHDGALITLGDLKLDKIVPEVVFEYRAARLDPVAALNIKRRFGPKPRAVTARTVSRDLAVLRAVLSGAVIAKHLATNPLKGEGVHLELKPTASGGKEYKAATFSPEGMARCLATLDATDEIAGIPRVEGLAFFRTAMETLLRRGSMVEMPRANYRPAAGDQPPHFVPLNAKVEIEFSPISPDTAALIEAIPASPDHDYQFPSFWRWRRGGPPKKTVVTPSTAGHNVGLWFNAVCAASDVACGRAQKGVTPHSTRHTGATWAIAAGMDHKTVMELGGWKNIVLFTRVYLHTNRKRVAATAQNMLANLPAAK